MKGIYPNDLNLLESTIEVLPGVRCLDVISSLHNIFCGTFEAEQSLLQTSQNFQ